MRKILAIEMFKFIKEAVKGVFILWFISSAAIGLLFFPYTIITFIHAEPYGRGIGAVQWYLLAFLVIDLFLIGASMFDDAYHADMADRVSRDSKVV